MPMPLFQTSTRRRARMLTVGGGDGANGLWGESGLGTQRAVVSPGGKSTKDALVLPEVPTKPEPRLRMTESSSVGYLCATYTHRA